MAHNIWNASLYQQKHSFVFEYGRELLALLNAQPDERILDIGCGTGQLTKAIADSGAQVTGLDNSPAMIESARMNFPGAQFVIADASDFSFDEPFDAVFSNAALHWVSDREGVVRCIAGALRSGGRFVAEFGGKGNVANILGAIQTTLFERLHLQVVDGRYFPSIGEYASLLEKYGLAVHQAWLFDRPTQLEGEDGLRNWIEMFCKPMFNGISDAQKAEVLKDIETGLRSSNYVDGSWYADYRRLRITAQKG